MVPSVFRGLSRGVGNEPDVRDEAVFSPEVLDGLRNSINVGNRVAFPSSGFK